MLKVTEKISVADAAVLSAAIELSADVFLTYDSDFANVKQIRCLKPEDYLKTLGTQQLPIYRILHPCHSRVPLTGIHVLGWMPDTSIRA